MTCMIATCSVDKKNLDVSAQYSRDLGREWVVQY